MTYTTHVPASRPVPLIFRLPPHRLSGAAYILDMLSAAFEAREERRSLRQLARMDAHLLRDLGLDSAALEVMSETGISPATPRAV